MKTRTHFYVERNNIFVRIMTGLMLASAVSRIFLSGAHGAAVWPMTVLPIAAALLYAYLALFNGQEMFYKTSYAVWLMAIYAGIWVYYYVPAKMTIWLFWVAIFFLAVIYTDLSSGERYQSAWLVVPIILVVLVTMVVYNRAELSARRFAELAPAIPDVLMLLGVLIVAFGIRIHPVDEYHPTWGDRTDGRLIRTLPPMHRVSPYVMDTRNGAMNLFQESFEITEMDRYIRQKRKEGLTNFGYTHVFLACYCRAVAKYPGLNRFIAGQKTYSRGDDIQFCMTVKKEMTSTAPETEIKVHLSTYDTAYDVYQKINATVEKVKNTPLDSEFDNTAAILTLIPGIVLKFIVWVLYWMDYFGMLPQYLLEVSPFHGTIFFTSMGSLGIQPIFHHLYDFGNLPVFGSFGCKRRTSEIDENGNVVQRKYIDFKFSMDDRIVDGFYYAAFFKYFKRVFQHPECLDLPPEEVNRDID